MSLFNDSYSPDSDFRPPLSSVEVRQRSGKKNIMEVIDLTIEDSPECPMKMRFSIPQSPAVDLGPGFGIDTPYSEDSTGKKHDFKIRESTSCSSILLSSSSLSSSDSEAEFDENDHRYKLSASDQEEEDDDVSFIVDSDDLCDINTTCDSESGLGSEDSSSNDDDHSGNDDNSDDNIDGEEQEWQKDGEFRPANTRNRLKSSCDDDDESRRENVFDFGNLQEIIMEYVPVKAVIAATSSPLDQKKNSCIAFEESKEVAVTPPKSSVLRSTKKIGQENQVSFNKRRNIAARQAYAEFNRRCFDNALPSDLSVSWNRRLRTTAGVTKMKIKKVSDGNESVRVASIELSEKVVDDEDRLRATLLHEMCHAAAWLIDCERKPPHGPTFWKWASIAGARSGGIVVTTCHNYDIHRPFKWICTNKHCGIEYTRHSKKGIDPLRHRCGQCRGKIEFVGAFNADMTPRKTRAATGFSLFVQEHFTSVKLSLTKKGKPHAHQPVMQELSRLYAISKNTSF